MIAGPRLGELVDSDENGKPGPAANGDDNDGEADEDGVIFNELIVPGETVMISVTMGREGFDGRQRSWPSIRPRARTTRSSSAPPITAIR